MLHVHERYCLQFSFLVMSLSSWVPELCWAPKCLGKYSRLYFLKMISHTQCNFQLCNSECFEGEATGIKIWVPQLFGSHSYTEKPEWANNRVHTVLMVGVGWCGRENSHAWKQDQEVSPSLQTGHCVLFVWKGAR